MLETTIEFAAVVILSVAVLIWNQPSVLYSVARSIDRRSKQLVNWMMVRAAAKKYASEAYQRAYTWYSEQQILEDEPELSRATLHTQASVVFANEFTVPRKTTA